MFRAVVPVLIALATVLMAVQPRMRAALERPGRSRHHGGPGLTVGVFLTGIYGGYFGAAQGVILIALLAIFLDDDLQRLNGTKNAGPHGQRGGRCLLRRHHPRLVVSGRADRRGLDHRRPGRRPLRPAHARGRPPLGHRDRAGFGVAVGLAVEWH